MSWVTVIFLMAASACLTLAGIYLLIWFRNRSAWANLAFSVAATATAVTAFCELLMMHAQTPAEYATALRWLQIPFWLLVVSILAFVRAYLGAGRLWLAWTAIGLRTVSLLLNFMAGQNLNFVAVTELRRVPFLGDSVAVAEGVPNPWMLVGQLSLVFMFVFVVDAGIAVWRRGEHRKALALGGSIAFFVLASLGDAVVVFWVQLRVPLTVTLLYQGIVVAMAYELSRDVLRATQLVGELRESEQRMTLAADAANLGIWTRDLIRNEMWATDRWRSLFGFTSSQPLTFDLFMERVHPDDREGVRQVLVTAADGTGEYETEYRILLPDGGLRWIASHGRVEFDGKRNACLVRGISRDCTARKDAEREMLLLRHEIAHVGRVSMMGQLASALAHEINQPLGAILRNAEAAELFMQNASPDLDEVRAILADIRKDDQRAGSVIDRMRGLLKRHELDACPLDVRELGNDVAALVRVDAAARQVKVNVDVEDALPLVRGDRVHLQQVLLNLILNGMDALQATSTVGRRVSVTARCDNASLVEISVNDTGPGIPADQRAHLFDPFFTTKPSGMGMGLSISRTIIEAHGGRLWAEPDDGTGATFRFTLPIAAEAARA